MNEDVLGKPPKFGRLFWVTAAVTTPVVLLTSRPWSWNLPLMSKIAGCVGLPLIAAISAYVFVEFIVSAFGGKIGRRDIWVLSIVWLTCAGGAAAVTFIDSLRPFRLIGIAVLTCVAICLFEVMRRKS